MEVFVQEASYTVNETATSLSVCVEINGTLERNVTVNIETVDGDAIGTLNMHSLSFNNINWYMKVFVYYCLCRLLLSYNENLLVLFL